MKTCAALLALVFLAAPAAAQGGWHITGQGVRTKKVAFMDVKVYEIQHAMKALPAEKTKQAVIRADVDKRLAWRMLRTVDAERVRQTLRDAYALNGYRDQRKIEALLAPLTTELREGDEVVVEYDADTDTTTLYAPSGQRASVPGREFMEATWRIWFGNIDQPELSDALIERL